MRIIYLRAGFMCEKELAHEYLQEMLELPEYYGKNLDALYDCLTAFDDVEFVIFEQDSPYWRSVKKVFLQAAKANERIVVTFL